MHLVRLPEAKHRFVLPPKHRGVERNFAWASRFRRLVHDYERPQATLAGIHFIVFAILMLPNAIQHLRST